MGFWNNPENNSLKMLVIVGAIAGAGLFVYSFAAGNPFGGFGRVLSKMFGFGYGYGSVYTIPTVYDHTNLPGCITTSGVSTTTGAPCSSGVFAVGITATSAKLMGIVISTGGTPVVDRGFNYGPVSSSTGAYTYVSATHEAGTWGIGEFSAMLTGLSCGTTYNFRAFAQNSAGVGYEPINRTFTTSTCVTALPSVTTLPATSITATSALLNANLGSMGGTPSVTTKIEYGTTTAYGTMISTGVMGSFGPFSGATTTYSTLSCNTLYHYRARATNTVGTAYGADLTFKTSPCVTLPLGVVTVSATDNFLTGTTTYGGTTLKGNLTGTGGAPTTNVSFEVGTTTTYGISVPAAPKTSPGTFGASVGLSCGKTYNFRAKANNTTGTVYGANMIFTTAKCTTASSTTTTKSSPGKAY